MKLKAALSKGADAILDHQIAQAGESMSDVILPADCSNGAWIVVSQV